METKVIPTLSFDAEEENKKDIELVNLINKDLKKLLSGKASDPELDAIEARLELDLHIQKLIELRKRSLENEKLLYKLRWMEATQKEVEARLDFKLNMVQLPELVWEKVFQNINELDEKQTLMNLAVIWRKVLGNESVDFLFIKVLPLLYKTKAISLEDILNCRCVSKTWKAAIDHCLQQQIRGPGQLRLGVCGLTLPGRESLHELIREFPPCLYYNTNNSSPLFHRFLKVDVFPHPYAAQTFLALWGRDIRRLQLDLPPLPILNFRVVFIPLVHIMEGTPNLQQLIINGHRNVVVELEDDEGYEAIFRELADSYPDFPDLKLASFCNLPKYFTSGFLEKYGGTLKTLTIKQNVGVDLQKILSSGGNCYPNLEVLVFESFTGIAPSMIPEEHFRDAFPALKVLSLQFDTNCVNDVKNVIRNVNLIGKGSPGLRHLHLSLLNSSAGGRSCVRFDKKDLSSLGLNLPMLEVLELDVHRVIITNIDFLLPLKSLTGFSLTFAAIAKKSEKKKLEFKQQKKLATDVDASVAKEIVNYKGYEKRMYDSNIWAVFPKLKFLTISIAYFQNPRDSVQIENRQNHHEPPQINPDKMVCKLYSRDGYIKFCQEQKKKILPTAQKTVNFNVKIMMRMMI